MIKDFYKKLDIMVPDAKCELEYNKDYELLIAVVLSAQCTDKRVNVATRELFSKYDIFSLAKIEPDEIMPVIRPLGSYTRKSKAVIDICKSLVKDYDGKVPNNREYLESLPGVGRKTCNVVLSLLYDIPCIAVDTHVDRVSKRLGLANEEDTVEVVEQKLMNLLEKNKWIRTHYQMVLFGRYICTSRNPKCDECLFKDECLYYKENKKGN